MNFEIILKYGFALLPTLIFLTGLNFFDSYKLVRFRSILTTIFYGGLSALICYYINNFLLDTFNISLSDYSKFYAPLIEEIAKAVLLIILIQRKKIGFLVDACIFGFASGCGFALIENIYYLTQLKDASLFLWIIRGTGTAVMHCASIAIMGIIILFIQEKTGKESFLFIIPGFLFAFGLHSFYNSFIISPVLLTVILILFLPALLYFIFLYSEKKLQTWMELGFSSDMEILKLMMSGDFSNSRIGKYIKSIKERFSGEIITDMLCLIRLYAELSIKAKGILLLKEAGMEIATDPQIKNKIEEIKYLENSIGKTGMRALIPILKKDSKSVWQMELLKNN